MTTLRKILQKHRIGALRGAIKPDFNRLIEDRYVAPALANVVRAPVRGSRGQSEALTIVAPDA